MLNETDYIIVGAGSAGCVLANRLSEQEETTVAIFEAGRRDNSWKIKMPAALTYNLENDKYNWFYHTESESQLQQRQLYWPRGKVLGGSSALNAMVYVRGHAEDYNRWQREGAAGWAYKNVLPYFKKSETYSHGADDFRGGNGPLKVCRNISHNPLYDAFIEAGVQAGYPHSNDLNGAQQEGFGALDMTINNGTRCSTAAAYLHPALSTRRNIRCFTNSHVTRVIFHRHKAIGVEYLRGGKRKLFYARKEVILCGGAINTPQLLMLSGVGPASDLKEHDINVVADSPGVGKNLQDHLEFYMQYRCKKPVTLYSVSNPFYKAYTGIKWFLTGRGLAASSHLEAGGFIKTRPEVLHPDIQYHFLPSLVNNHGRDFGDCHAFQVHVGTMRPESRGELRLVSANPLQHVQINANYLQADNDLRDLVAAIPLTRDIFEQAAFKPFKGAEIQPGIDCKSISDMERFVRAKSDNAYHPCGTCKMGIDDMSVVAADGRVHGVESLRVVDASIMPSIVSGNLNATVIMMAEKIADGIQ